MSQKVELEGTAVDAPSRNHSSAELSQWVNSSDLQPEAQVTNRVQHHLGNAVAMRSPAIRRDGVRVRARESLLTPAALYQRQWPLQGQPSIKKVELQCCPGLRGSLSETSAVRAEVTVATRGYPGEDAKCQRHPRQRNGPPSPPPAVHVRPYYIERSRRWAVSSD